MPYVLGICVCVKYVHVCTCESSTFTQIHICVQVCLYTLTCKSLYLIDFDSYETHFFGWVKCVLLVFTNTQF